MIQIQSQEGIERRIVPVFVCDVCQKPINDIHGGAAVFRAHGLGEGELYPILHVHQGRCQEHVEAQLGGHPPWHMLADHVNDVVAGMGVTIREMINKEAAWTASLTPEEHNVLQERITELGNWLRQHGVNSPLWG